MGAPELSPAEAAEVARFGLDKPPQPLFVDGEFVVVPVPAAVQHAITQWVNEKIEELELVLSEFGLTPRDIVAPVFERLIYEPDVVL